MLAFIHRGHQEAGFFVHALAAFARERRIAPLPKNRRTDDARYVCIVPVHHFGMLAKQEGVPHYTDIEPEIFADVRAGRAVILFDMCNAGTDFQPALFETLYAWVEANDLPAGRVIWLAANRALADRARLLAGMRANLIDFAYFDFFVRATAWRFSPWSDARLLDAEADAAVAHLLDPAAKDRLLLCLAATPKLHRALAFAALQHHGLVDRAIASFPGAAYAANPALQAATRHFIEDNPLLGYLARPLQALATIGDLRADDFAERGKALWPKIDPATYTRTCFSLVLESEFSDGRIVRVTEKLTKAFCMGHPVLVLGNPGAIALMRELGFQDWDGVLDRSSETITDPAERFEAVLREVLRQSLAIGADRAAWLARTRAVSEHNLRHALSGDLLNQHVAAYDDKLIALLTGLVAG